MASVARYCCCGGCVAGNACSNCGDDAPGTILVTFSSVTLCSCHAAGSRWLTVTGTINDQFTLTQDAGDPCVWKTSTLGGPYLTRNYYINSSCTSLDISVPDHYNITLTKGATDWTILVHHGSSGDERVVFYGQATALTDGGNQLCQSYPSLSNQGSSCGAIYSSPDKWIATGGSATLVCQ